MPKKHGLNEKEAQPKSTPTEVIESLDDISSTLIYTVSNRADSIFYAGSAILDCGEALKPNSAILGVLNTAISAPSAVFSLPSCIYDMQRIISNPHKKHRPLKMGLDILQIGDTVGSEVALSLSAHGVAVGTMSLVMTSLYSAWAPIYLVKYLPSTIRTKWRLNLNYRLEKLKEKIKRYQEKDEKSEKLKLELALFEEYLKTRKTKQQWEEDYLHYKKYLNEKTQGKDFSASSLKFNIINDIDSGETLREKIILRSVMQLHDQEHKKFNAKLFVSTLLIMMAIGSLLGLAVMFPPLAGILILALISKVLILAAFGTYAIKNVIIDGFHEARSWWKNNEKNPDRRPLFFQHIKHQVGTFLILAGISVLVITALVFPPATIAIMAAAGIAAILIGISTLFSAKEGIAEIQKRSLAQKDITAKPASSSHLPPSIRHTPENSFVPISLALYQTPADDVSPVSPSIEPIKAPAPTPVVYSYAIEETADQVTVRNILTPLQHS